jgi:hypothetical protein
VAIGEGDEQEEEMTDINTRHPRREGASQNIAAARGAAHSLRQQVASILQGCGVPKHKVDAFDHKWSHEIDQLLREVERNR